MSLSSSAAGGDSNGSNCSATVVFPAPGAPATTQTVATPRLHGRRLPPALRSVNRTTLPANPGVSTACSTGSSSSASRQLGEAYRAHACALRLVEESQGSRGQQVVADDVTPRSNNVCCLGERLLPLDGVMEHDPAQHDIEGRIVEGQRGGVGLAGRHPFCVRRESMSRGVDHRDVEVGDRQADVRVGGREPRRPWHRCPLLISNTSPPGPKPCSAHGRTTRRANRRQGALRQNAASNREHGGHDTPPADLCGVASEDGEAETRRLTETRYAPERARRIGSSGQRIPSVTRVGSNTSTSPGCSRSNASPVTRSCPSFDLFATVRPDRGGVVDRVIRGGQLHAHVKDGRAASEAFRQLLSQVVRSTSRDLFFREDLVALLGYEVIAPEACLT